MTEALWRTCHQFWATDSEAKPDAPEDIAWQAQLRKIPQDAALERVVDAVGYAHLWRFVKLGAAEIREENLKRHLTSDSVPNNRISPKSAEKWHARNALAVLTDRASKKEKHCALHIDECAADELEASEESGLDALKRSLQLAREHNDAAGELVAEAGAHTKVFVLRCSGNMLLLCGWASLELAPTSKAKADEVGLATVLRVYRYVRECDKHQAVKFIVDWLSSSPHKQFPWRVYGVQSPSSDVALSLRHDNRSRSLPLSGNMGAPLWPVGVDGLLRYLSLVAGSNLTEQEKEAGSATGNIFCMGRSGTGKTTIAMLRLVALELLRPPTEAAPRAMFLTASPVLSREVLRTYTTMTRLRGLRKMIHALVCPELESADGSMQDDSSTVRGMGASSVAGQSLLSAAASMRSNSGKSVHSLGSWFALESLATEDSFEMVEGADVYAIDSDPEEEWLDVDDVELLDDEDDDQEDADYEDEGADEPTAHQNGTVYEQKQDADSTVEKPLQKCVMPIRAAAGSGPSTLADAKTNDFPMFLTVRQLLHMLDAGLRCPFFARGDDARPVSSNICSWQPEGGGAQLVNEWLGGKGQLNSTSQVVDANPDADAGADELFGHLERHSKQDGRASTQMERIEITYDYFAEAIWPNLERQKIACTDAWKKPGELIFHPSVVWTEIAANIKGSEEAFELGGAITEEMYVDTHRRRGLMSKEQKRSIYAMYITYEGAKHRLRAFDEADFVQHLRKHLRAEGYVGPRLHSLFVDEVQDVSQAVLRLLLEVVEPKPGALYMSGDAAQTISKGLAFRLSDLRSAFLEGPESQRHLAPSVVRLTTNFRCAEPILQLANAVLTLLHTRFPESLDHGGEESSSSPAAAKQMAVKPQRASNLEDLVAEVSFGNSAEGGRPAFGADLVVIVKEQDRKKELPALLQHCLVMTVWESKGLEFDTVVVFDFFADAQADWSVLGTFGPSGPPDDWQPAAHALLCCELKQLYVAVTRAKRRVFFYDEHQHKGVNAVFANDLVGVMTSSPDCIATGAGDSGKASPEAWREQGKRLLELGFAAQAELCFTWSGDELLRQEAEATRLAKDAATSKARVAVGDVLAADGDRNVSVEVEKRHVEEEIKGQFLKAAQLFDGCKKRVHAAKCLAAAGEWEQAAQRFEETSRWDEAATAFVECKKLREAATCFEKGGQWRRALGTWERANDAQGVLRCGREALKCPGLGNVREECLRLVGAALESLPTVEDVRVAAAMFSARQHASDQELVEFLIDELYAEGAALRFVKPGTEEHTSLAYKAFKRSLINGKIRWDLLEQKHASSNAIDRCRLAAIVFNLKPPSTPALAVPSWAPRVDIPEFRNKEAAVFKKLTAESSVETRGTAVLTLLSVELKDSDPALCAAADICQRARLLDDDVLLSVLQAHTLPLGRVKCALFPSSAQSAATEYAVCGGKWSVAPTARLLSDARARVAWMVARILGKRPPKAASAGSKTDNAYAKLQATAAVRFVPRRLTHDLTSKYAAQAWDEAGLYPNWSYDFGGSDKWMYPVLLDAASAHTREADGLALAAMTLLPGRGDSARAFLELPGAERHNGVVQFVEHLRRGMVDVAAAHLAKWLEDSSDSWSPFGHFFRLAYELTRYLAGPATVVLKPVEGVYVLTPCIWDWPEELGGDATALSRTLRKLLMTWEKLAERIASPTEEEKKRHKKATSEAFKITAIHRRKMLAADDSGQYWQSMHIGSMLANASSATMISMQLAYALGKKNPEDEEPNEELWSEEIEQPLMNAEKLKVAKPAVEKELSDAASWRTKRRAAAKKITRWLYRCLRQRGHPLLTLWPLVLEAQQAVALPSLPVNDITRVAVATENLLSGQVSALQAKEIIRKVAVVGLELQRQQQAAQERAIIESTKEHREQQRDAKRARGRKKNEQMQRRAELQRQLKRAARG